MDLATLVGAHYARRWFLPTPLRAVFVVAGYMAFLRAALHELAQPRLTVPVLDASAIGISFVKRDVNTAGQTMFLLNVGELLEDYTRAMSENELINSLLDVPDKAQKVEGDTEVSVPATELEPGDLVAVRTGMSISIDGVVERGSAMVNQATLTGEPLAVERSVGDDVFAGTVVEDGSILVRVRANTAQTKLRSIVSLVQTADSLKSEGQSHMEELANKIVPWNFLLAGLVALTTRSLGSLACSRPTAGARTTSCASPPAWRSTSRTRWRAPSSTPLRRVAPSIASVTLRSSTSSRTASPPRSREGER